LTDEKLERRKLKAFNISLMNKRYLDDKSLLNITDDNLEEFRKRWKNMEAIDSLSKLS